MELPKISNDDWVISLNKAEYLLKSNKTIVTYKNVRNYFDTVIELATKYNNSAVLSYAFKVVCEVYSPKRKKNRKNTFF